MFSLWRTSPPVYEALNSDPVIVHPTNTTELHLIPAVQVVSTITTKKDHLKKACEAGDMITANNIMTEIRRQITPDDYEEYLTISLKNNASNVLLCVLLHHDLYILDTSFVNRILLFACKNSYCELFDLVATKSDLQSFNVFFAIALQYNEHKFIRHLITMYKNKIYPQSYFSNTKYMLGEDVFEYIDPLIYYQLNPEMFTIIASLFLRSYPN